MIFLILTWKKRVAHVKLIKDATETPHIDSLSIGNTEYNLRSSVKPGLNIGVDLLVLKAAAAKVNNLDARLVDLSE